MKIEVQEGMGNQEGDSLRKGRVMNALILQCNSGIAVFNILAFTYAFAATLNPKKCTATDNGFSLCCRVQLLPFRSSAP